MLKNLFYSFPIQLLILHVRNNHLLLFCWVFLYLMVGGYLGRTFGLKYLFLDPEYLGEVNFWSFALIGFTFGAFLMAWNITTYILNSYRFPFLASLKRPFTKFCVNNFILPAGFLLQFIFWICNFQNYNEFASEGSILFDIGGLFFGVITSILLSGIYFYFTNKDILNFSGPSEAPHDKPPSLKRGRLATARIVKNIAPGKPRGEAFTKNPYKYEWKIDYYLNERFQVRLVRNVEHYNAALLLRIFKQNHINALVLQGVCVVALITMGFLIEYPVFLIPAGASILLILTILIMIIGALTYWLKKWRTTALFAILLVINYLTSFHLFTHENKAYGMDYNSPKVIYDVKTLEENSSLENFEEDKKQTLQVLEKWKANQVEEKPKLVCIATSGGGLRAAVWTMQVLQKSDSLLQGELMDQTRLITGASGGMLGAAFYRELLLQKKQGKNIELEHSQYLEAMANDLQNGVAFTIVVNDLFLPWVNFDWGGHTYRKDRGYIFEQGFLKNTTQSLDKPISAYIQPETEALIPMMILSPVILNDSRQLFISPLSVSYMNRPKLGYSNRDIVEIDGVDFQRQFANNQANNLRFTSAIRMNATYPYFLPSVTLPSTPAIEVMDAGFRDNFGISSIVRFCNVFSDWIKENTDGVVIVQIRGSEKTALELTEMPKGTMNNLFTPFTMMNGFSSLQDFQQDNELSLLAGVLGADNLEVVKFIYKPRKINERASMSFHLTTREKQDILNAYYLEENQNAMYRLQELLGKEN